MAIQRSFSVDAINGATGVIVPPEVDRLRAAIAHVMDPARASFYAAMGQRARWDVLARFNEETFRHGLLRHAGAIIGERFEPRVAAG